MRDLGITFAGGGNRAFYQQGLLDVWGERLWHRVAAVSGVSAGAAIATLLLSGRAFEARAFWDHQRRGIKKNLDATRLLRGLPLAPHGRIYHSTMMRALEDGGLERIRALPFPVYVLCTVPHERLPIGLSTWLGLGAYALEKQLSQDVVHPTFGPKLGFREVCFDARACTSARELADLVLASSATPPFTPVGRFRGQRLLDGGIIDNVPAAWTERQGDVRKNLVLLTRPYPATVTGRRGARFYVAPSTKVPVERWDYTEVAPIGETLALGREDAADRNAELDRWLSSDPADDLRPANVA